jgi:Xaa-Pro aminopeptidase/Xaa-Pro dipeptidase
VGLEIHEGPAVTGKSKTVLKENMVITIEPGIYIPGLGGVRIEDMVIVERNSCRVLYRAKKDFTFLP